MAEGGENLDYAIKLDPFISLPEEFAPLVEAIALRTFLFCYKSRAREDIRRGLRAASSIVLANLLKAREINPALFVKLSLSSNTYTKSRYTNYALSYRFLKNVINYLSRDGGDAEIEFRRGFLDRREGGQGRWSRIRPAESFSALLKGFQDRIPSLLITNNTSSLPVSLIEPQLDFEIIRLKDENKKMIDYEETDETLEMRSRVAEWNQFAKGQWPDIFVPDAEFATLLRHAPDEDQEEANETAGEDHGAVLDLTKRFLYRVFNNRDWRRSRRRRGVEHYLAKVRVVSSNLIARSNFTAG